MAVSGRIFLGSTLPRNVPNAPIYYAYNCQKPAACCAEMFDDVLFNRRPPYDIPGGVKDALDATRGELRNNRPGGCKGKVSVRDTECIDILNAPSVAWRRWAVAVLSGAVNPEDIILLNITGGGVSRVKRILPTTRSSRTQWSPAGRKRWSFWRADHENLDFDD